MNRQQLRKAQREAEKTNKKLDMTPIMPLKSALAHFKAKYPSLEAELAILEQKARVDASNEVFNLIFGCVLVALHDKNNFTSDQLNQLVSDAIFHLDCISSDFITKEDLMGLVVELGVKVEDFDFNKVRHNARQTHDRLKVYFEEVEAMNQKDMAIELFEQGVLDENEVATRIGGKVASVKKYKSMWRQAQMQEMTPEEFTEKLFALEKTQNESQPQTEVKPVESVQEEKEPKSEPVKATTEEVKPKRTGLKKVVKVISIEGEFATYEPVDQAWTIIIDEQELVLSREQMKILAAELLQVADEAV